MNAIDFDQPDTAKGIGSEISESARALVLRVRETAIVDVGSLEQAVIDRQLLGDMMKQVTTFFAPFKSKAHELHKMLCAAEAAILNPLAKIDGEKRTAIRLFKAEQDRIREERERVATEARRREEEARALEAAAAHERAGEPEV